MNGLPRREKPGQRLARRCFDDDPSTYQALQTGQVDAIAETRLTGDELHKKNLESGIERKFMLLRHPSGITMRANQFNLHQ